MNSEIKEEILLRKLIDDEIEIHIPVEQNELAQLNVDSVSIIIDGKEMFPFFYSPRNSREIVIILDEKIPSNERIKLNLYYSTGSYSKGNFLYLYPFSSVFYDLSSPLIGINNPYLLTNSSYRENITEINLYSIEMDLPLGYEYKENPLECQVKEVMGDKRKICEGNSGIKIFSSDCGCFNDSEVCIFPIAYAMTPIPIVEPNKVFWSSSIINNAPSGFSFSIKDVQLYRFVFFIFLIISGYYLFSLKKIKERNIEVIILYLSTYLLIRLSLKIPLAITLFEIILSLVILSVLLIKNQKMIFKLIKIVRLKIKTLIKKLKSKRYLLKLKYQQRKIIKENKKIIPN